VARRASALCSAALAASLPWALAAALLVAPAAPLAAQAPDAERVPLPEPGEVPPGPAPEDPGTMLRPDPPAVGDEPPALPPRERLGPPQRVAAIEFRSDARLTEEELDRLAELVVFAPGATLTDGAVARTLRNLQASGIVSRVAVLTRAHPSGDGVVAVIALWGNIVVSDVRISGDTGSVSAARLREVVPQRVGEPLVETRLVEGVFAMQDRLANSGHFGATVHLDPQIDEARKRAVVVYRVEAGPRATVGEVRFAGDTAPFTPAQLLEPLHAKSGEPYRRSVVLGDAERLETWLIGQGHRTARVDRPAIEPGPQQRVAVVFPIAVGPRVEVEVIGADMRKLRKRGLLPFLSDEGYDEALVLLAAQRIRTWYQEQGHYDVAVDYREVVEDGVLRVVLEVDPGPQVELEEVDFAGNEEVADGTLRQLVQTAPAGLLGGLPFVGGGTLVDEVLNADVDNVLAYYRLQGYLDAEVGPARVDRRGGELHVVIPIVEGRRRTVEEIRFSGLEALDESAVRRAMPLAEDGPYHPAIVEESLEVVRSRFDVEGYNAAQVSATHEWDADETRATVTIRVLEGPQTVVDRMIVRGNERTRTEVIRGAIDLANGEPVSTTALLEAERDLYRLGIFSRVEVELTPAPLGASTRDVVVRVEEGDVQRVTYGAGYDSESGFGGILGYSHANLLGRAIHGAVDVRVRQEREEYRLFVDQPQFFGYRFPVTYSLFQTEEERSSFEVRRRGVRVEGFKHLGQTRVGLAYDYRIVENRPLNPPEPQDPLDPEDPDAPEAPDPTDLQRQFQELQVASLVPNLFIDRRDDPISPTEGWNSIAQLQVAFPLFAAEADWLKLFLQHVQYFDVGFGTFVASARLGGIEALSELPADIRDPFIPNLPGLELASEDVFLAERFFAGGATTHRGFEQDDLGIPFSTCLGEDDVFDPALDCAATLFRTDGRLEPAGGNGLALVNLEYRVPIFGPVEGVAFFDSGNVWSDWRQIDVGDFANGVGLGLRYVSPIGPLRLDVGYPLDPIGGEDGVVWFISLGNPF
jgi:outer membrane protein assembly complex protein YaeT